MLQENRAIKGLNATNNDEQASKTFEEMQKSGETGKEKETWRHDYLSYNWIFEVQEGALEPKSTGRVTATPVIRPTGSSSQSLDCSMGSTSQYRVYLAN